MLMVFFAVNWVWRGCWINNTEYPLTSLREASELTGVQFPKGAVLSAGRVRRGWVPGLWAVVRIPKEALDEFTAQPRMLYAENGTAPSTTPGVYFAWGNVSPDKTQFQMKSHFSRIRSYRRVGGGSIYDDLGAVDVIVDPNSATVGTAYISWVHD